MGLQVVRWRWQWGLATLRRHRVRDHVVERWEFEDLACGRKTTERLCNASQKRNKKKKKKTYLDCVPANGVAGNGASRCGS